MEMVTANDSAKMAATNAGPFDLMMHFSPTKKYPSETFKVQGEIPPVIACCTSKIPNVAFLRRASDIATIPARISGDEIERPRYRRIAGPLLADLWWRE